MKRNLVITYKPDVLSMVEHDGSFKQDGNDWHKLMIQKFEGNNYKGLTSRSERESFKNIKTIKAAERIVSRRNKNEIIVAKWNNEVVFPKSIK